MRGPLEARRREAEGRAGASEVRRGQRQVRVELGAALHGVVREHAVDLAVVAQAARVRRRGEERVPERVLVLEAAALLDPAVEDGAREGRPARVERAALDVPERRGRSRVAKKTQVELPRAVDRVGEARLLQRGDVEVGVEVRVEEAVDARPVQHGGGRGDLVVVVAVQRLVAVAAAVVDGLELSLVREHALAQEQLPLAAAPAAAVHRRREALGQLADPHEDAVPRRLAVAHVVHKVGPEAEEVAHGARDHEVRGRGAVYGL